MLINLQVRDFAIVDRIDIEFSSGMTVLTGETGAGKSILVDALGLVLGERGGAQLVRKGANRAEFSAQFAIGKLAQVQAWLVAQALDLDEDCLLRRVINSDGRSRAFINGNAVPIAQLKKLGEMLLDIHGQHFHQSLGRRGVQLELLDHFGGLLEQRAATGAAFSAWRTITEQLQQLLDADAENASRQDLLVFQLQELDALDLSNVELDSLNSERQRLQNSGKLAAGVETALTGLVDDESRNVSSLLAAATRALQPLSDFDPQLAPIIDYLNNASIQVTEASESLQRYAATIDMDPQRQDWVEERLDAAQTVARKHRIATAELPALTDRLRHDFAQLQTAEQRGQELEQAASNAKVAYLELARSLSTQRAAAAITFANAVTAAMSGLGMPNGVFEVSLSGRSDEAASAHGIDTIEFLISANPGQAPQSLAKIASGGELSRMSLSIQVIASDGSAIPTMIFDEVDSGVGGGVAEMVGRRLQELSIRRQILCVTHLPQVASLADQHFRISKVSDGQSTRTRLHVLGNEERIDELARMLGGVEITQKTLAHAAEMLASAAKKTA